MNAARRLTAAQVKTSTLTKKVATIQDVEIYSHRVSGTPGTHIILWNDEDSDDWDTADSLVHAVSLVHDHLVDQRKTPAEVLAEYASKLTGQPEWQVVRETLTEFHQKMNEAEQD